MPADGFTWSYERLIMRGIAGGRRGARARRRTMAMPGADTDELARFGYKAGPVPAVVGVADEIA
jgi:hypothetical protein